MKEHKLIQVEWEDITFFKGVYEKSEIKNLTSQVIETTGYLIEETKDYLVMALSIELTGAERVLDIIKIPKANIIKRREIK